MTSAALLFITALHGGWLVRVEPHPMNARVEILVECYDRPPFYRAARTGDLTPEDTALRILPLTPPAGHRCLVSAYLFRFSADDDPVVQRGYVVAFAVLPLIT